MGFGLAGDRLDGVGAILGLLGAGDGRETWELAVTTQTRDETHVDLSQFMMGEVGGKRRKTETDRERERAVMKSSPIPAGQSRRLRSPGKSSPTLDFTTITYLPCLSALLPPLTMAKKALANDQIVKLIVGAGQASPSPPVGPALGSRGVKSMDFCKVRWNTDITTARL